MALVDLGELTAKSKLYFVREKLGLYNKKHNIMERIGAVESQWLYLMVLTCVGRPINLNHMSKGVHVFISVWTLCFVFCPLSVAIRDEHYKVLLSDLTDEISWHTPLPKAKSPSSLLLMPAYCSMVLKKVWTLFSNELWHINGFLPQLQQYSFYCIIDTMSS